MSDKNLGLGVMLGRLSGNRDSADSFSQAIGKTIVFLTMDGPERSEDETGLRIGFRDGSRVRLFDDGQPCCERRYMHTDDDLTPFIGAKLIGADVRDGPTVKDRGEEKECAFLIVRTSKGEFTIANYNEHNGYYAGFLIRCMSIRSGE